MMVLLKAFSLLKNWKVIVGVLGVAGIGIAGFHYKNVVENKVRLESKVQSLEASIDQQESDYDALERSMTKYQSLLDQQREASDRLRDKLNNVGNQNEEVQQCLDTELPGDFINSLSE